MTALYAMGAVCFVIAVLLWAVIRGAKREGADEAKVDAREETIAAVQKAAADDRKATERMADAQAASVGEPVSAVVERMRNRNPKTK